MVKNLSLKIEQLLSNTGDVALKRRAAYILQNLNLKKGLSILDVGCGDGFYIHLLSNLSKDIKLIGIDPDKNALNSAKKNLSSMVRLILGEVERLPFKNKPFDRVVVSEVLEHLDDDVIAIREIYRVLKPGGLVFFSVPHQNYPFFWDPVNWMTEVLFKTHIKSGFWAGFWNNHIRLYTESSLSKSLREGGFKNIKVVKLTHYCLPFNHYIINIVARLLVKNNSPRVKKMLSKYKTDEKKAINLFTPIFFLDKLNDYWNGYGSAVSLIAIARKK